MNILVTGSNGQLGNEFQLLSKQFTAHQYFFTDVNQLDITKKDAIDSYVQENHIDIIINCAAYTAVDKAEEQDELAMLINSTAVSYLAESCKKHNALLVHISTDYVFDGKAHTPYIEEDATKPLSIYAKTKFIAEQHIENIGPKALIFRTSWLYSYFGNNFVKSMQKYGKERGSLGVVFDQIGSPTYAHDLALAILKVIESKRIDDRIEVYHYSNEGVCSWYDFAKAIMELSNIECDVNPIRSEEYPLPAPRPMYSVLDKGKIKKDYNIKIPHWRESLKICIEQLEK